MRFQAAGCGQIFEDDTISSSAVRPVLRSALAHLRADDTLVVWRLDRPSRSLKDLISSPAPKHCVTQGVGL